MTITQVLDELKRALGNGRRPLTDLALAERLRVSPMSLWRWRHGVAPTTLSRWSVEQAWRAAELDAARLPWRTKGE